MVWHVYDPGSESYRDQLSLLKGIKEIWRLWVEIYTSSLITSKESVLSYDSFS